VVEPRLSRNTFRLVTVDTSMLPSNGSEIRGMVWKPSNRFRNVDIVALRNAYAAICRPGKRHPHAGKLLRIRHGKPVRRKRTSFRTGRFEQNVDRPPLSVTSVTQADIRKAEAMIRVVKYAVMVSFQSAAVRNRWAPIRRAQPVCRVAHSKVFKTAIKKDQI
jgi:hypothetical protein